MSGLLRGPSLLNHLAANAKAVFAEERAAPRVIERRANWLDRLRPRWAPALALSAMANVLLMLGLGYEVSNLARYTAPRAMPSIAGVRAEKGGTPAIVRHGETSVLILRPSRAASGKLRLRAFRRRVRREERVRARPHPAGGHFEPRFSYRGAGGRAIPPSSVRRGSEI